VRVSSNGLLATANGAYVRLLFVALIVFP